MTADSPTTIDREYIRSTMKCATGRQMNWWWLKQRLSRCDSTNKTMLAGNSRNLAGLFESPTAFTFGEAEPRGRFQNVWAKPRYVAVHY